MSMASIAKLKVSREVTIPQHGGAKRYPSGESYFGFESGEQSRATFSDLPSRFTVGAAEFEPPASGTGLGGSGGHAQKACEYRRCNAHLFDFRRLENGLPDRKRSAATMVPEPLPRSRSRMPS
ncbi:MAG: hypothetical protein PS018_18915 [bacterium]|nr:hypothetical protein [bacterium]